MAGAAARQCHLLHVGARGILVMAMVAMTTLMTATTTDVITTLVMATTIITSITLILVTINDVVVVLVSVAAVLGVVVGVLALVTEVAVAVAVSASTSIVVDSISISIAIIMTVHLHALFMLNCVPAVLLPAAIARQDAEETSADMCQLPVRRLVVELREALVSLRALLRPPVGTTAHD